MPVDNSPSYSCTQRNVFNFFSILESNRLSFPILLITVQSPSLHFFSQVLTVVLIKEYFGYLVVNFLIAEAGPKSLAYRPTSTSQQFRLDIFSGARMSFASPLQWKQAPLKQLFLSRKLKHWLSEYHRFYLTL